MINTNKAQIVRKACLDTLVRVQPHARWLCGGVAVPGGAANSLPVRLGMIWVVLAAFCTYQPGTPQVVRLLSQRALVNRVFISRFGRLVCLTE